MFLVQFSGGCNLEDMENVKVYYYLCLQLTIIIKMRFCVCSLEELR